MSKRRLKGKKIDLVIDLSMPEEIASLQEGFSKLHEEGARLTPLILVKEKTPRVFAFIKKIPVLPGIINENYKREIVVEDYFCSLFKDSTDLLFMVTASDIYLNQLYYYLKNRCGCSKKHCDNGGLPIVIALVPGYNTHNLPGAVSQLLNMPRIFWVPFGWLFSQDLKLHVFTRTDLWDETCALALEGKQIQPFFIEVPGTGIKC